MSYVLIVQDHAGLKSTRSSIITLRDMVRPRTRIPAQSTLIDNRSAPHAQPKHVKRPSSDEHQCLSHYICRQCSSPATARGRKQRDQSFSPLSMPPSFAACDVWRRASLARRAAARTYPRSRAQPDGPPLSNRPALKGGLIPDNPGASRCHWWLGRWHALLWHTRVQASRAPSHFQELASTSPPPGPFDELARAAQFAPSADAAASHWPVPQLAPLVRASRCVSTDRPTLRLSHQVVATGDIETPPSSIHFLPSVDL